MLDNMVMKSYEYLMQDTFNRIKGGKITDENFKPYTEEFIKKILQYFENKEEYEKCKTISDFLNIRFNHDLNYK